MVRKKLAVAAACISVLSLFGMAPLVSAQGNSNAGDNVTICHATGSQTNPYVQNSPNKNAVVNGHNSHQNQNDIIPPFDYNDHGQTKQFPGQNWDAQGQAIYNNGCKIPAGGLGGGQVLGASTAAGSQIVAPQGGVAAGAGGGSHASNSSLIGLAGSLISLGAGVVWLRRRVNS